MTSPQLAATLAEAWDHHRAGREAQAEPLYRQVIEADPRQADALHLLGAICLQSGRAVEAVDLIGRAVAARPDNPEYYGNLGAAYGILKQHEEAVTTLRHAVQLAPQSAAVHFNLGTALREAGQFEPAIEHLRRAIELDPEMADAHSGMGTSLQALARYDEALRCYERALAIDPQSSDAHFSRATCRLRAGDWERGFEEYEWRWKCKGFRERKSVVPRWDGASLTGKTILLYAEQGFGDNMQFIRYAPAVKARGPAVIFECPAALQQLLASCRGIDQLVVAGAFWCEVRVPVRRTGRAPARAARPGRPGRRARPRPARGSDRGSRRSVRP